MHCTTENRFRWLGHGFQLTYGVQAPRTDAAPYHGFNYARTSGHKGSTNFAIDANNYVEGYITDDGANSILNIDTVVGGSRINKATVTLGARIADAAAYYLRLMKRGNTITLDYFTSTTNITTLTTSGANTLTHTFSTAQNIGLFGAFAQGYDGISFIPGSSSGKIIAINDIPMCVVRGSIRNVYPRDATMATTSADLAKPGVNFADTGSRTRYAGLLLDNFDNTGLQTSGTITEFPNLPVSGVTLTNVTWITPPAVSATPVNQGIWRPADYSWQSWSIDPLLCGTGSSTPTLGTLTGARMQCPNATTLTKVWFDVKTAATSATRDSASSQSTTTATTSSLCRATSPQHSAVQASSP